MTIYVATTNAGKLRDFAAAAQAFGVALEPLPGLRDMPEPMEDGATFEANARKKAEHYSRLAPGLTVIADDSGLEVDALCGAPGVRSARFADDAEFEGTAGTTDQRNNEYLLERLALVLPVEEGAFMPLTSAASKRGFSPGAVNEQGPGLKPEFGSQLVSGLKAAASTEKPRPARTARYRAALAVAKDGTVQQTAEGSVEGQILREPRGAGGFGYDPLFWLPQLGKTMAEIDLVTKQQISHRGNALPKLLHNLVL
jgi:XTP/dITP diphosphohydrolase